MLIICPALSDNLVQLFEYSVQCSSLVHSPLKTALIYVQIFFALIKAIPYISKLCSNQQDNIIIESVNAIF